MHIAGDLTKINKDKTSSSKRPSNKTSRYGRKGYFLARYLDVLATFILIFFSASIQAWPVDAQIIGEDLPIVETIATTLDHIREELNNDYFELNYLGKNDLLNKDKPAFFFITDAVSFAKLNKNSDYTALAAMKNPLAIDSAHTAGAAFVVRSDRADISSLKDLKDKVLLTSSKTASVSYMIGMSELLRIFGEPNLFGEIIEVGGPIEKVVHNVLEKQGDVGIIDACTLERMEKNGNIPEGSLRVIGKKDNSDLACQHSTDLYPGWVFAVNRKYENLNTEERSLCQRVFESLLRIPKLPGIMEWTIPSNNASVRSLLSVAKQNDSNGIQWRKVYETIKWWLCGFVILFLLLIVHSGYVSWQVKKRTKQLTLSIHEATKLQRLVAKEQEKISLMERAGVAGQLSSLIAHELQQPLNAIANFSRGLRIRSERGTLDENTLEETLSQIIQQGELASQIVNKVRNYAKQRKVDRKVLNLSDIMLDAVAKFRQLKGSSVPQIKFDVPKESFRVKADPLEINLIIFNLLKNCQEACAMVKKPRIDVKVFKENQNFVALQISDNGPPLSAETFATLFEPGKTTKEDGLGLGLTISRGLAEAQGGKLIPELLNNGTLLMKLLLPRYVEHESREDKR